MKRTVPRLFKGPGNARKIRGPATYFALTAARSNAVQVQLIHGLASLGRDQAKQAVFAGSIGDECPMRQSDWQAGTTVVVDVLTNNIDTSRGRPDILGLVAESFFKELSS
ncbi:hypothetical protein HMPREF9061_00970 [Actinomyces sp. oral taxon 181 str. F0379]|nr:hypothetical protein HMPREF9061_00970 [Actinomyces sp. oral taxon 181 str. F0379]